MGTIAFWFTYTTSEVSFVSNVWQLISCIVIVICCCSEATIAILVVNKSRVGGSVTKMFAETVLALGTVNTLPAVPCSWAVASIALVVTDASIYATICAYISGLTFTLVLWIELGVLCTYNTITGCWSVAVFAFRITLTGIQSTFWVSVPVLEANTFTEVISVRVGHTGETSFAILIAFCTCNPGLAFISRCV